MNGSDQPNSHISASLSSRSSQNKIKFPPLDRALSRISERTEEAHSSNITRTFTHTTSERTMAKLFQSQNYKVPSKQMSDRGITPIKEITEPMRFSQELMERSATSQPSAKELIFGVIVLFIGAFAVSYLMMPASFAKSGVLWATITLIYSGAINYISVITIIDICRAKWITNYFEFYVSVLGRKFGFLVFLIFIFNAFAITFSTLMSLNTMIADLCSGLLGKSHILAQQQSCLWAVILTVLTTPFVYKSSTGSLSIVSALTAFSIVSSLIVVGVTCFQKLKVTGIPNDVKVLDFTGTIYSFDVSYFSFLIQLNVFDLFTFFSGTNYEKYEKIKKSAFWVCFVIFVPYLFIGGILMLLNMDNDSTFLNWSTHSTSPHLYWSNHHTFVLEILSN